MVHQEHGFISTQIFEEWGWEVFIPELARRREELGYSGEAVLIMDGLTCHHSDFVEDLCFENNCIVEILPAHSSDQIQPCDLGIIGAMKANASRIHPAPDLSKQSKQVLNIVGSVQTTLLPPTIVHAFARAGIISHYSPERHCLIGQVDVDAMAAVRHRDIATADGGVRPPQ
jgi:hypothetical protein